MFIMTYNQAMLIQRAQLAYYRQIIGRQGVKQIRAMTICPLDINPNELLPVRIINQYVPRGGDFEALPTYKAYMQGKRRYLDPLRHSLDKAIRAGKIYG